MRRCVWSALALGGAFGKELLEVAHAVQRHGGRRKGRAQVVLRVVGGGGIGGARGTEGDGGGGGTNAARALRRQRLCGFRHARPLEGRGRPVLIIRDDICGGRRRVNEPIAAAAPREERDHRLSRRLALMRRRLFLGRGGEHAALQMCRNRSCFASSQLHTSPIVLGRSLRSLWIGTSARNYFN